MDTCFRLVAPDPSVISTNMMDPRLAILNMTYANIGPEDGVNPMLVISDVPTGIFVRVSLQPLVCSYT